MFRLKEEFEKAYQDIHIENGPSEIRFLDHASTVIALTKYTAFDEDKQGEKQFLISASMDPTVKIWDLENNSCLKTIELTHAKNITAILYFKKDDADFLLTTSKDLKIHLVNLQNDETMASFEGHQDNVNCLLRIPEETFDFSGFLSGGDDCCVKIWKFESSDAIFELKVEKKIKCMKGIDKYGENGLFCVILGLECGDITVYDVKTQKFMARMEHEKENSITCLEILKEKENKHLLLSGSLKGSIKLWNLSSFSLLQIFNENSSENITCLTSAFYSDRHIFFSGSKNSENREEVKIWTTTEKKSLKSYTNYGVPVESICYFEKYQVLVISWNNGFRVIKID